MLSKKEKVIILENYLNKYNNSYNDTMKDELYFYFFDNESNLDFLDQKHTSIEIINKVDILINKMIMHEDEDRLYNIIENYI